MSGEPVRSIAEGDECRCVCGSLVARVVADGVELKCRRCKRKLLVAVPLSSRLRLGSALRVRAAWK